MWTLDALADAIVRHLRWQSARMTAKQHAKIRGMIQASKSLELGRVSGPAGGPTEPVAPPGSTPPTQTPPRSGDVATNILRLLSQSPSKRPGSS
jgi:hypothetical protein